MSRTSTEQDSCITHTKCPPGKYTKTVGSVTTQPECEVCETGYFKAFTSTSSVDNDSCVAHTTCPPGKYTTIAGSVYAEPRCETCAVGFFKAFTSRSSMCAGTASRPGGCARFEWVMWIGTLKKCCKCLHLYCHLLILISNLDMC